MVKAAADITPIVRSYIERLRHLFDVERVILSDIRTAGVDGEVSDVRFIVVSPAFAEMEWGKRIEKLALVGLEVDPVIQAWPYTPNEVTASFSGAGRDLLLPQLLYGSREVYKKPGVAPLKRPAKR